MEYSIIWLYFKYVFTYTVAMENPKTSENISEKAVFRQVGLETLPEIVNLNREIFDKMYPWPPYDLDQYSERLKNCDPVIFIAEEDGKMVGNSISYKKENSLYLWILGVQKDHRGKGLGSQLYALNEEYARNHGLASVSMKVYSVSEEMIRAAESRGYKKIDTIKDKENSLYDANVFEFNLVSQDQ